MNKVNSEAIMQLLMLWLYSQLFCKTIHPLAAVYTRVLTLYSLLLVSVSKFKTCLLDFHIPQVEKYIWFNVYFEKFSRIQFVLDIAHMKKRFMNVLLIFNRSTSEIRAQEK